MTDETAMDIKREALAALRKSRTSFTDPRYLSLLRRSERPVRVKASQQMMAVEDAYQVLLKTRIDSIREKLHENSDAIKEATKTLKKRKAGLEKLQTLLDGTAQILSAVGSIVKLVL
jgi:hypothetical protein